MSKAQLFTPPEQTHTVLRTISDLIPESPQARFYPAFLPEKGKTPALEITIACFPLEQKKKKVWRLRAGFSPQKPRFDSRPARVKFVVGKKGAPGRIFSEHVG